MHPSSNARWLIIVWSLLLTSWSVAQDEPAVSKRKPGQVPEQVSPEGAAYLQRLNDNLAAWAAAGYYMSIDFKMRNLNDGQEQIWIESMRLPRQLPVPGTLALAGLGLLAAAGVARRRRG